MSDGGTVLKTFGQVYVKLEKLVPALIFVSIFFVMLMEIFSRMLFAKSWAWNTEYCRFALVWVTFLGCVYVRRERSHIKVSALYDYFVHKGWTKVAWLMDLLQCVVAMAFWFMLAYYGWRLSYRVTRIISPALEMSLFWLYLPTCICGVLAGIMEIFGFFRLLKGGRPEALAAPKEVN